MEKGKIALILTVLVLISGMAVAIQAPSIYLYVKNLITINGSCFDSIPYVAVLFDVEPTGKDREGGWP